MKSKFPLVGLAIISALVWTVGCDDDEDSSGGLTMSADARFTAANGEPAIFEVSVLLDGRDITAVTPNPSEDPQVSVYINGECAFREEGQKHRIEFVIVKQAESPTEYDVSDTEIAVYKNCAGEQISWDFPDQTLMLYEDDPVVVEFRY